MIRRRARQTSGSEARHPVCLCGMLLCLASAGGTAGDIHQWTDADGKIHFGDRPPADVETTLVTVKPNVYTSPSIETTAVALSEPDEVVMYSAEWCGYCKKARRYFVANGIRFKEYDVEKSRKGQRDFKKLRAKGVPVILVGDQRMNGFSESAFRKLYETHQPDA